MTNIKVLCIILTVLFASGVAFRYLDRPQEIKPPVVDHIQIEMDKIIHCETRGNHDQYGDGGRAYGVAQFHKSLWHDLTIESGMTGLNYYSEADQRKLLRYALEHKYDLKWTCSTAYKKRQKERRMANGHPDSSNTCNSGSVSGIGGVGRDTGGEGKLDIPVDSRDTGKNRRTQSIII